MTGTVQRLACAAFALVCLSAFYVAQATKPPTQNKNATPGSPDASALYAKHCDACHGKDGRAKTFKAKFNHARNLTDPTWQAEVSDERLFNSISNGKGKMPAFGKKLSEAEINALIAYVRSLKIRSS